MLSKKELWEMDFQEWRETVTEQFEKGYGKSSQEAYEEFCKSNPDKIKDIDIEIFLGIEKDKYEENIHCAVRQGKPVPDNILKLYPGIEKEKPELINIKINRKILQNALTNIKPIISGRHTLAILSSILISVKDDNTIGISATNLETGFHGIYPAKVITPGEITIPYKELLNFISKLKSEEIHITEPEKYQVTISDGSATCNIACMDAEDFPILPEEMNCKKIIEIDALVFKNMIAKAIVIHPQNEIDKKRMHIVGAFFKAIKKGKQAFLQMASTNGGVLVQTNEKINIMRKIKKEIKEGGLIPKSELSKLSRAFLSKVKNKKMTKRKNKGFELFESSSENVISLTIQGNSFIAQKENETIAIRLLEGDFPNYQDIIDRDTNKFPIIADREVLLDAMKQMASMQNSNYYRMGINIGTNVLKMIFINPDIGEMKKDVVVQYNGDDLEITYCPSQFVDFLSLMKSDIVNLDIINIETPCLITGDQDKETIFVIMPFS